LRNKGKDFAFDVSGPAADDEDQLRSELIHAKHKLHDEQAVWAYLIAHSKSWQRQLQANPKQTYNWFQNWYADSGWRMPE